MKPTSRRHLDQYEVAQAEINLATHAGAGSRTEQAASGLKEFVAAYRNELVLLFLLALTIWMAANWYALIRRIVSYYTPLPYWDYWRGFEDFLQFKSGHFQFFWRQHVDHRIIFPDIVFILDMLLWHGRQFLPLAASFVCYFLVWLTIARVSFFDARLSPAFRLAAVLFAGIVMGWEGCAYVLGWPFLLQWTLVQLAAILSLFWLSLAGAKKTSHNSYLVLAIVAGIVANYSSGNGLVLWPVLIGAGLVLPLHKRQRVSLIVSAAASIVLYFVGFQFSSNLNITNFYRHPIYSLAYISSYLSMPFGSINAGRSPDIGICAGLVSLVTAAFLFVRAAQARLLATRTGIVLFGSYFFALFTAILTAAGRMNYPDDGGYLLAKAPRYVTVPVANWAILISLVLWLAGRQRLKIAPPSVAICFALLLAIGSSKAHWWFPSEKEFADAQEAILSLEDGLTVPRLLRKLSPYPATLARDLVDIRKNHLSIYYKPRTKWLGLPVSHFGTLLSDFVPGGITEAVPVASGVEIAGWADRGGDSAHYRWIILANETGQIAGFGERLPANTFRSGWVGFANAHVKSSSYRAYLVSPAGLYPLPGSVSAPGFEIVARSDAATIITGIKWQSGSNLNLSVLPNIRLDDSPQRPIYSSWSGSDAITGKIVSSSFDVAPDHCMVLPVLHGPSVVGESVTILDAETGQVVGTVSMFDFDNQWVFWPLHVGSEVKRLRIVANDNGHDWGNGSPSRSQRTADSRSFASGSALLHGPDQRERLQVLPTLSCSEQQFMSTYLVTGGSGFFGGLLKNRLLADGYRVVNVDLCKDEDRHPNLTSIQGDIRDATLMERTFDSHRPEGVFHVAAMLAHAVENEKFLWTSNVDGTRIVAECSKKFGVSNLVFTSSNCLWGNPLGRPVTEDDAPSPVELYGRSKEEGEKILNRYQGDLNVVTIRCPTIIDSGRLGLLSILFEFIHENRKVWTVGGGHNRYQFIYAQDLADAAIRGINYNQSGTFNIGSDNVRSIREIYSYVIEQAGSSSRIASLPRGLTLSAMKLAHLMKLSPLGPYHYKMIAEDFVFDTTRIKSSLGWKPTLTNEEMLFRAYRYYATNRQDIDRRQNVSAHRKSAGMGVIRLLKWVS